MNIRMLCVSKINFYASQLDLNNNAKPFIYLADAVYEILEMHKRLACRRK